MAKKEVEKKENTKAKPKKEDKNNEKNLNTEILIWSFVAIALLILLFIVLTKDNNNLKGYCAKAVCNSDNTMCSVFEELENGQTKTIWKGDCSKIK